MNFSNNDLVFIPLGGSGEIGMNCNLYHYKNSWIMIDLGVMFGNSNLSSNELIMPNIDFLTRNKIKLDGLILTHAHEDHIGAVPFLYEKLDSFKIFTTSFTASVLKRKFDSLGIKEINIELLKYNENKKIGQITSGIYSPRIKKNIGLSMILKDYWEIGENIIVQMLNGEKKSGTITTLPFPQ